MLTTISRPAIAIYGTENSVIEQMVNLMPDYSAGQRLHSLYVNKLQGSLPGNYSQLFGTGPSFRSVFFPSWGADSLLHLVDNTGLDGNWWSNFSIAVMCQAIRDMASRIRDQMLLDKINSDVSSYNNTLRERSSRAYAKTLEATYSPLIELLNKVDRATAKQEFHDALLNNVLNRQLWYQAGMWTSPEWEMFNQYAKYIVLGASDAEVDTLIGELEGAGLPVPGPVKQGAWRSYAEEFRDKPNVDLEDIRSAAAGPIGKTTYIPVPGAMPASMPNGNCYEFTANSQPGNPYRQPPGGSCFTGDTEVLTGDGAAVKLRDVQSGDTVLTRDGTATVAFVAQPLRYDRSLYRLTNGGPVFTATHPFLNGAPSNSTQDSPTLLALEPRTLAGAVPTLSEDGIGKLRVGSTVLSRALGSNQQPVYATVTGVEEVDDKSGDSFLYDLDLVTCTGVRQEFWVGQGEEFFLVSPEFPVLDQAAEAATAIVALMEGLLKANGPERSGWPLWITDVVNQFGAGVFNGALMESLATTPSFGAPAPQDSLYDRIDKLYRRLDGSDAETKAVMASLFDGLLSAVGQWLVSLVGLGWRTSMVFGGDVLALTVFDLALTSSNPIPADAQVLVRVTVRGRNSSEHICMWNRRGRANTRFHHYFDQLLHVDLLADDSPSEVAFAVTIENASLPALVAEVPRPIGQLAHRLRSAVLRDSAGQTVGTIRFDTRQMGQDAASQELAHSGLWTEEAACAYANCLGKGMVEPILDRLRTLAASTV